MIRKKSLENWAEKAMKAMEENNQNEIKKLVEDYRRMERGEYLDWQRDVDNIEMPCGIDLL